MQNRHSLQEPLQKPKWNYTNTCTWAIWEMKRRRVLVYKRDLTTPAYWFLRRRGPTPSPAGRVVHGGNAKMLVPLFESTCWRDVQLRPRKIHVFLIHLLLLFYLSWILYVRFTTGCVFIRTWMWHTFYRTLLSVMHCVLTTSYVMVFMFYFDKSYNFKMRLACLFVNRDFSWQSYYFSPLKFLHFRLDIESLISTSE